VSRAPRAGGLREELGKLLGEIAALFEENAEGLVKGYVQIGGE